ncbi:MAG: hypothetical protein HY544_04970 [Candidatus Diapherotrites archaeon]|uniref:Lon proteolytic domain-containing protein n=1 Tax=Candidatus Iainarchaeum sp. TaxID=3101447 RepID=A0A8T3YRS1_9ARCH|nr:hypothetical protein [Candidatus Diapherotrites archaeon]
MKKHDSLAIGFVVVLALVAFFEIGFYSGLQRAAAEDSVSLERLSGVPLEASAKIVSVTPDGSGSVNEGDVEIVPGSGRILLSLNPFAEPDTQDSMQTAALVAQRFTGKSLEDKDVIFSVKNTPARLIGGPSAGAAMSVAAIAAIRGENVRADAAITGTINADGTIGQVGGVIEKATAAAEQGLSLFVVPKGQKEVTYYEQREERSQQGRVLVIRRYYVPRTINLEEMLADQNYGTKIAEAADIGEAVDLLISK